MYLPSTDKKTKWNNENKVEESKKDEKKEYRTGRTNRKYKAGW